MQGIENPGRRETETWRLNIVIVVKGGQAWKLKEPTTARLLNTPTH